MIYSRVAEIHCMIKIKACGYIYKSNNMYMIFLYDIKSHKFLWNYSIENIKILNVVLEIFKNPSHSALYKKHNNLHIVELCNLILENNIEIISIDELDNL